MDSTYFFKGAVGCFREKELSMRLESPGTWRGSVDITYIDAGNHERITVVERLATALRLIQH